MKLHRSRRTAAGLALMVALPLTGCTTPGAEPGVAARVGDRTVSEHDVDTATTELGRLGMGQQFDTSRVTEYLAFGPLLLEEFRKQGLPIGAAEARGLVKDQPGTLSPATEEILRTQFAASKVGEAQQALQQFGPNSPQGRTYAKVVQANQAFNAQMQTYAQEGGVDLNPKYMKQPANWVLQDGPNGPAQSQQAPRQ